MMPQIMSVIQVRFDGAARARALSAYTAVLSSGFVAGQVVGGVLVTANLFGQTWRPVFLVNVPIGLAVLALVPRVVPRDEAGHALAGGSGPAAAGGQASRVVPPRQHRRQLDLAVGVATFGSLFLTLDTGRGTTTAAISGHALAITMSWLAAAMLLAVAAGIPLARTVAAARRSAAAGGLALSLTGDLGAREGERHLGALARLAARGELPVVGLGEFGGHG
jgi:hypothetical protein